MLPGRCTGQCCAVFTLSANVLDLCRAGELGPDKDAPTLLQMLVPLTSEIALLRLQRLGFTPAGDGVPGAGRAIFSCRNWDEVTRLCTIYDRRPWLCWHYPDPEHVCMHCGWQRTLTDRDPGDETGAEQIPRWATTW